MAEKAIRIAIADGDKALTAIWRVWIHGADVYVASRSIAGHFKTSLHRSGVFRHAFISDAASEKFRPPGTDRAVSKWSRPAPQAHGGTLLFQLLIPESELHPARHDQPLSKDVVRLPRPTVGMSTYVSVLEIASGTTDRRPQFEGVTTRHLVSWRREDGSTIWVTAYDAAITTEQEALLANFRAELAKRTVGFDCDDQPGELRSHLRSFAILQSTDGVGRLIDVDAEFLRSIARHRRIAERAYFLWQNRTGERWWDPLSNWCQAERTESA